MAKHLFIALLVFIAGVAGNLVAGWLQQGEWALLPTPERFLGTLIGVMLILFFVALLETEHALSWNWYWHRFWYLRELLKNPDLRRWETDFARLEMVQRKSKISAAEVLVEGRRQDMVDVLRERIIGPHEKTHRALVLGEPGSGKTTGLERLTLDLTQTRARRVGIGWRMPVLLRFGNFQQGKLLDYLIQTMRHNTRGRSGKVLSKGIEKLLEKGRIILLCDALDEALGERRETVLAELVLFLESRTYHNVPVVITSRTREDPGGRLKGLEVFEIQDLNDEAVEAFIHAYKKPSYNEEEINRRLESHKLLEPGGLGRNPFWLRLIVESGAFAGNKGQILNTAVDTLLAREWNEKPGVGRSWGRVLFRDEQLEETKLALAWLGYQMSTDNMFTIEESQAKRELGDWLKRREQEGISGLKPQDVLGLGRDAQLLVYDPGPVRFRHRLLQEFMTAWILLLDEDLRNKKLEYYAQNPTWWETLFLLGGLMGSNNSLQPYTQFVQQVLGDGRNDYRLFASIGLLRSVTNPSGELVNTIMTIFAASAGKDLTPNRFAVARELGRILGDEAAEAFSFLVHSSQPLLRRQGAQLLCCIEGQLARGLLLAALGDSDSVVRQAAATALDKIGYVSQNQAKILTKIGNLWNLETLLTSLHHPERDVRMFTVWGLGEIEDARVIDPLIVALSDFDPEIRRVATWALGKVGDKSALDPLITALLDSNRDVRRGAAWALGEICDDKAVESLIATLYDSDSYVRQGIAEALGKIGDARAVESLLIIALHDSDFDVRRRAVWALEKLGGAAHEAIRKIRQSMTESQNMTK